MADGPFDPDAYLASKQQAPTDTPVGPSWGDMAGTILARSLVPGVGPFIPAPGQSWGDRYNEVSKGLQSARETLGASTDNVVSGIPVVGPLLEKGLVGAASLPAALGGGSVSNAYTQQMEDLERARREHPIASTIGQIAGSTLATVPVVRAAPALFGGNSFLGQTAASTALGAADAATRSNFDPTTTMWGAGIGAAAPALGSILAPVGQLAGAGVRWAAENAPGVSSLMTRLEPLAAAEIRNRADAGYNSLRSLMQYEPGAFYQDLPTLIRNDIYHGMNMSPTMGAPRTSYIVDQLHTVPPTPGSLHTMRKELDDVIATGGKNDKGAALMARNTIDHFLENPPPNAVLTPPGQGQNAMQILRDANADWRVAKSSQDFNAQIQKGIDDAMADNKLVPALVEGRNIMRNTRQFLRNKNQGAYLDVEPGAREALQSVASSSSAGEGLLDAAGKLSQTSRLGFGSFVPAITAGAYAGWPGLAAALAGQAGGIGANLATTQLTRNAVRQADQALRSAAPSSQAYMRSQLPPPIPGAPPITPKVSLGSTPNSVYVNPYQHRNEIARLLMLQGERQATQERGAP